MDDYIKLINEKLKNASTTGECIDDIRITANEYDTLMAKLFKKFNNFFIELSCPIVNNNDCNIIMENIDCHPLLSFIISLYL